ncbi:3-demethylubiquinol 3-O-methyltransferase [Alloactinosynnema sp. L-07]|uniref:bifunctional 2-polyprenyl-6-hydroxyphenol methylase/3-demethylubiquinol 3-O-methyltransferase UbiG n=1 Tax=Alloactinosynnema sp. L-07 TaxID=1653480 RepID=UPI00065EF864|nr:bifunctional 2-polyprenyl-6-hydroxyphenol methylase/3-demethylubiquinol 3-O-methyltransferase UbiG [Alloactinosynnema sp. L-07]CRK55111.1 3-demethylubiquinol 3-O-methyltransferase [Alloactinosynnema sp. L-07]
MAGNDRHLVALDPTAVAIDNEYYHEVGDDWWNESGPLRALHEMNPARVGYFHAAAREAFGREPGQVTVLDIGCGGGLVSERMAALGYDVTGVDLSEGSIETARKHAAANGVTVNYVVGSAYELPAGDGTIDMVVISDVLEHLHDLPGAVAEIARVLRDGGIVVFDTINRTVISYLKAIVLSEKILKIIYPGTHNWKMFIRPSELTSVFADHGLVMGETRGLEPKAPPHKLIPNALRGRAIGEFHLTKSTAVSYIGQAVKNPAQES